MEMKAVMLQFERRYVQN